MDEILERIVDTDRAAREKVSARRQRLEAINDEIACARDEIDRKLREEAQSSVERTKKQTDEKMKSETERIDRYFETTRAGLSASYEENREKWVNEIFAEVTK